MNIKQNVNLSEFTSFGVGGPAENFALVKNSVELEEALRCTLPETKLWLLGYGSNSLVSDNGLPGMIICTQGGNIEVNENEITADAGVWWDDVVKKSIDNNLWGIELMSEIPGSVGGSVFINITAYGQSLGPQIKWVKVWDRKISETRILEKAELNWDYKNSIFQKPENEHLIILQVCIELSSMPKDEVTYQKALDVAEELRLDLNSLDGRREAITEARKRAGSLWHPNQDYNRTAGSFFRNPKLTQQQADTVMKYDESGKTKAELKKMNQVHGGDQRRVSAAHVMLAAGFKRGQTWGKVKLNEQNLLKIEALPGASAQDIFGVVRLIQTEVKKKLDINLEPEARILGAF